ncbi:unnamed protein product [Rhodiola kirilowii]
MISQISSTSSSNSDDSDSDYEVIDEAIDDLYLHHYSTLVEQPLHQRRHRSQAHDVPVIPSTMDRGREQGHIQLYNDYFAVNAVYSDNIFRRQFRMRKHVFLRIMEAVTANDTFFAQRQDATGRMSFSPLQKCTSAMRMLAYGLSADAVDEYLRLSETTAMRSLLKFIEGVISCFGEEYLRRPTRRDLDRLLRQGEQRGFPGMIGSIDCMHWEWKNCPATWKAQYQGSCNDLNVLYRSPVFDEVLDGKAPEVNYSINGQLYKMGYYLTDGIYPRWATFIQGITLPQTNKQRLFADRQAAVRKDVERAFGGLQSQFAIIRKPSLAWDEDILSNIMVHNE